MTAARHSRVLRTILLLIAVCFVGIPVQAQYGGGTGEANDPYLIHTAEHLDQMCAEPNDWDRHFKLMADVDLSGYAATSRNIIGYIKVEGTGRESQVVENRPFSGVFDGNGHTISNFSYISSDTGNQRWGPPATDTGDIGLFGYVDGPNAEIKDLGLIDPNIITKMGVAVGLLVGRLSEGTVTGCHVEGGSVWGSSRVGGLVGYNRGAIIDCYSVGSVTGSPSVGGLVGYNEGAITNCYSSVTVSGTENIGGLVGGDWGGTITNCTSSGSVSGIGGYVGGLVGDNNYGTIRACHSSTNVSGRMNIGGLVGDNEGTISDCSATGSVTGTSAIGGLVGFNWGILRSTITNSYSTGSVLGEMDTGGLVGSNNGDEYTVIGSFWDVQTSEQSTSAGGTGKTTAEMQVESTFTDAGWDFVGESLIGTEDIWTFYEGTNYPRLAWAGKPVDKLHYGGGSGTQANPYLIYTAEQLNTIGLIPGDWGRHFKLMADIDLSGLNGTDFNIIGYVRSLPDDTQPFFGVFDGNGKKISNFNYYSETEQSHVAIFAYADGEDALIKDLGLIDPNVDVGTSWKSWRAASLVAMNSGRISNCYVQGGTISGSAEVGGLVGINLYGTITNCYSATNVSGDSSIGGLVGSNRDGTITSCYATSSVLGLWGNVGGLVGSNDGIVTDSFWHIETSGQPRSAGGTGLATGAMQTATTFLEAGWDFINETANGTDDIWRISEGLDYPRLWWEKYGGGTGEPNDPYLIYTAEHLNALGAEPNDYDKHFKLMQDIDLSGYKYDRAVIAPDVNDIEEGHQGNSFSGVLDGNNQAISHLTIAGDSYLGLFGQVEFGAIVSNLGLEEIDVNGTGDLVGGLVGYHSGSIITTYSTGTVIGEEYVGGLVGKSSCIVDKGRMYCGTIESCYSCVDVSGAHYVGGLVGDNLQPISNCYATGSVLASGTPPFSRIGGLVGNNRGIISNCYAAGNVPAPYPWFIDIGGLVGMDFGKAINSFWDTQTSAQTESSGGTPKTTVEMQTANTFLEAGWDFADELANGNAEIWWILEGQDYPRLWWERPYEPSPEPETDETTILGTWSWDVETDTLGGSVNTDFWWSHASSTNRYLNTMNDAKATIVSERSFEEVDLAFVNRLILYSRQKFSGSDVDSVLTPGTIIAFQTSEGNKGKLRVEGYRALHDFSFPEASYLSEEAKANALTRPNNEKYHLRVKWCLF